MTLFATVLQVLVPLFALILLGYLLRRYASVLHLGHLPSFNALVVNVTLPALVFLAILRAPALSTSLAAMPAAMLSAEALTMGLAYLTGRALRLTRPAMGMLLMMACFGNTAFLGYPIARAVVPHDSAFAAAVVIDQFGMTLPMLLTAGILGGIFGGSGKSDEAEGSSRTIGASIRRWVRSPMFLAAALSIVLRLVPWPASLLDSHAAVVGGAMIAQTLDYLGRATTPIALLSMGAMLQPRAVSAASRLLLVPCAFKLLVCPLLMWAVCRMFGEHGDLLRVGVLQASMPTSVTCSLLCAQYEMEGGLAGGAVFTATALSVLTIPLIQTMLR